MIKRFNFDVDGCLEPYEYGDYVNYDDHITMIKKYKHALALLYYIIHTDMPQVLNEDSGGNGQLAVEIEELLK